MIAITNIYFEFDVNGKKICLSEEKFDIIAQCHRWEPEEEKQMLLRRVKEALLKEKVELSERDADDFIAWVAAQLTLAIGMTKKEKQQGPNTLQ